METILIHSTSIFGSRNVNLATFDKLLHENKLQASYTPSGATKWSFKTYSEIHNLN